MLFKGFGVHKQNPKWGILVKALLGQDLALLKDVKKVAIYSSNIGCATSHLVTCKKCG